MPGKKSLTKRIEELEGLVGEQSKIINSQNTLLMGSTFSNPFLSPIRNFIRTSNQQLFEVMPVSTFPEPPAPPEDHCLEGCYKNFLSDKKSIGEKEAKNNLTACLSNCSNL